jgi:hypothetical protein
MGQGDSEVTHQVSEAMSTVGQGLLGAIETLEQWYLEGLWHWCSGRSGQC